MISARGLFETHLTVADLQRSMRFFGDILGLELAEVFPERRVAFYWIGGRGNSMLGLWEVGTGPQRLNLHLAFRSDVQELLEAPARLRSAGIVPLDFEGAPTDEPVVRGKHLALVDDVMTTGSTLAELARACRKAGAVRIEVWTAARAV